MPLVINLQNHLTVLIGSPDGLILAVDSLGRKLTSSSFDPSQKSRFGILSVDASDWPLTMGGITLDSNDNSTIQLSAADLDGDGALELLAQSGTGNLNVWTLKKSSSKVGSVALKASASNISGAMTGPTWLMAGGNGARQNFFDVSTLNSPADASPIESIEEFFLFPSPVRGPVATVHLKIGADAKGARLRIYDLAGVKVKDQSWENLPKGLQAYNQVLDVSRLGADVYTALIEVTFASGTRKKWVRFGVIR